MLRKYLCGILAVIMLLAVALPTQAMTVSFLYDSSEEAIQNPYIGNAVWATDLAEQAQPFSLVYADITWAEWEPKQGVFEVEAFEERIHLDHWRAEGKHVILRFVIDKPSTKKHMDIPEWLYDATNGDGQYYNISYGRGYNPNYENRVFIQAHKKAIKALGNRYGQDPVIAYIELGSLGHWGEWHVHSSLNPLPFAPVRDTYIQHYLDAFQGSYLMMRRPFAFAAEHGLGLFNDSSGILDSTERWLSWIESGGLYDQTGEEDALASMWDAWRAAPIGGELGTSVKPEKLLGDLFEQTKALFARSHTSWIGPGSFAKIKRDGKEQENLNELMKSIGYRLRVSRLDVSDAPGDTVRLSLTWENDGIAPFYFDWQPCLLIEPRSGSGITVPLEMRLLDVQPDTSYTVSITLAKGALPQGEFALSVGIVNPTTHRAEIALAMNVERDEGWYELARMTVR